MKIFNFEITRRKVSDEYTNRRDSFVSKWARPPALNTSEWLGMFSTSPRLSVVDRIASDIANVGGKLLKVEKDGTETELTDHPFLDFMKQPNPLFEMTSSAMWRLHEIYLLLVGESFFLIERDERGKPVELWNVPPHWVQKTPHMGNPNYQIISPGGQIMEIPVDDMFVMKQLNPLDPFMRGLGIAQSIADEVEIDEYAAKFQKRFFYNDATPPTIFIMPEATDEQRDTFLARWNQKFKGVNNSHRAAALSGNVKVEKLGDTGSKNLAFVDSRIAMRDAVLEHFGVPREIMGITENSNRSTADAAQYIYAKNVLTPRISSREEAINKQLLPLFGRNLVWRFDEIVPYDNEFRKSVALEAYAAGMITKNEGRKLLNLDSVDGGDTFKISVNDLFIRETEDPAELTQNMLKEDEFISFETENEHGEKKSRRINLSAILRAEELATRRNAQIFEAAATRFFADQKSRITKALGLDTKADDNTVFAALEQFILPDGTFKQALWDSLPEENKKPVIDSIAKNIISWDDESKRLTEIFKPLWKKAYDDGVAISEEYYSLIGIDKPEFVSAAKINGGKRIVGIQQTTMNKIAQVVADGISNGISQMELRKAIQAEMNVPPARIKIIARQETMTALATGQFETMSSAGAKTKTWHHRPQKNPRDGSHGPNHIALEGETVHIDGRFSNGLRFPRDPADDRPEELINCRCYLTYGGF